MLVKINYELRESKAQFVAQFEANDYDDATDLVVRFVEYCETHHYHVKEVVMDA